MKGSVYELSRVRFKLNAFPQLYYSWNGDHPNGNIEAETNKSSASDENETLLISMSAAGAIPPGNHDKMTKNVVQV